MIRKIIHIDEEKCNGCGACAQACHEGAIAMVNGKAKLIRDDYCDGFGDCLPNCPTGAITFTEREAAAYDEEAVKKNKKAIEILRSVQSVSPAGFPGKGGCPGSRMQDLNRRVTASDPTPAPAAPKAAAGRAQAQLGQWPCQIKLLNPAAPYFQDSKILIAADCTAYAYANMHEDFMKGRITLIGCPKLDDIDYSIKLTEILKSNNVKDVLIVRMEVPCCGGLEMAAKKALQACGKMIPWRVVTIGINGEILD